MLSAQASADRSDLERARREIKMLRAAVEELDATRKQARAREGAGEGREGEGAGALPRAGQRGTAGCGALPAAFTLTQPSLSPSLFSSLPKPIETQNPEPTPQPHPPPKNKKKTQKNTQVFEADQAAKTQRSRAEALAAEASALRSELEQTAAAAQKAGAAREERVRAELNLRISSLTSDLGARALFSSDAPPFFGLSAFLGPACPPGLLTRPPRCKPR